MQKSKTASLLLNLICPTEPIPALINRTIPQSLKMPGTGSGRADGMSRNIFTKQSVLGRVVDKLGEGETLRVWYLPQDSYDPWRFLDITVYQENPFFVIGWGVKNNKEYTVRARTAEVLLNGVLFNNQKYD